MKAKIGDVVVVRGVYFDAIKQNEDGQYIAEKAYTLRTGQTVIQKAWYANETVGWMYGDGHNEFSDDDICQNLTSPLQDPTPYHE